MKRDEFEYLTAYKLAVKLNKLNAKFLSRLHALKISTIEGYVYEKKRNPKFQAIFELYTYLRLSKKEIPSELHLIFARSYQRARYHAKKS